ncbi:ABC transporter permease [Herminiimonas arsenitoxidans]|uniref:ABC transporter permease n=1 Tax=Herminiimonas arsenitoxidans TaxID=1809410 RepID=UPI0009707476|nr:ABC transporter permease [Herminiimonas arsenitoxidans]
MSKPSLPFLGDRTAGALLVIGLLLLVEVILRFSPVSPLVLAPPSQIAIAFWNGLTQGMFGPHLQVTLTEMLTGFAIGSLFGLISGVLITEFGRLGRLLYPYLIAIQSLPKVAVAPLLIIWLGYGLSSKIVLVALITFFPVLINTMAGLSVVDQLRLDLMATLNASRWQTFIYVRLPSAATHIFAGLGVAIVLALTGAVVAEFVGAQKGLGVLLLQAQANLDTAGMFAILIILAAIGLGCNLAIRLLEHKLLYWIDHHNQKGI